MLGLSLQGLHAPKTILCLGAHCDDVEIGCGATLRKLAKSYPAASIKICVLTGDKTREAETRAALSRILEGDSNYEIDVQRFRNGHFPYCAADIKAHIESYKDFQPDLIFTHYRFDHHQDHRTVSELTANTFRDNLVFEYEILKYDSDLGNPNVFVPVTKTDLESKVSILMDSFGSQLNKQWFKPEVFESIARIRGVQCASPSGYAEAFYGNKISLAVGED